MSDNDSSSGLLINNTNTVSRGSPPRSALLNSHGLSARRPPERAQIPTTRRREPLITCSDVAASSLQAQPRQDSQRIPHTESVREGTIRRLPRTANLLAEVLEQETANPRRTSQFRKPTWAIPARPSPAPRSQPLSSSALPSQTPSPRGRSTSRRQVVERTTRLVKVQVIVFLEQTPVSQTADAQFYRTPEPRGWNLILEHFDVLETSHRAHPITTAVKSPEYPVLTCDWRSQFRSGFKYIVEKGRSHGVSGYEYPVPGTKCTSLRYPATLNLTFRLCLSFFEATKCIQVFNYFRHPLGAIFKFNFGMPLWNVPDTKQGSGTGFEFTTLKSRKLNLLKSQEDALQDITDCYGRFWQDRIKGIRFNASPRDEHDLVESFEYMIALFEATLAWDGAVRRPLGSTWPATLKGLHDFTHWRPDATVMSDTYYNGRGLCTTHLSDALRPRQPGSIIDVGDHMMDFRVTQRGVYQEGSDSSSSESPTSSEGSLST